jgi:hypothetical protein
MVENLEKLLHLIADNPSITCDELDIETSSFYNAEKYFKEMIGKVDGATSLSVDLNVRRRRLPEREIALSG